MADIKDKWQFAFVLPNLSIKQAIDSQYVAIVPSNDQRAQNIITKYPILRYLVDGFSDQFKRTVTPNLLIFNTDIPLKSLKSGALIDFRNICAICCTITAWQNYLIRGQWFTKGQYSEYFSLYPIIPTNDYEYFTIQSPAVLGIDRPKLFSGQTAPELAGPAYDIECDPYIFTPLIQIWEKRYINGRLSDQNTNILFRSLQVACQACAIPDTNYPSIYDYGVRLAQWVSAFEILARPKNKNVRQIDTLNLINQFTLESKRLRNKRYVIFKINKKGALRGTLPQKLCHFVYEARNDFLHGNPVSSKHIYPWHNTKTYPLNFFAPLLYKLMLICFLKIYPTKSIYEIASDDFEQFKSIRGLEEALLKSTSDVSQE
jgi:hypothetical protein